MSHGNQLKVSLYSSNDLSNFGSGAHGWPTVEKSRSKFHFGRVANDVNGSPDALIEQNRDPRTIKSKNYLAVKAYTTRAGDSDTQGNITIYTDQYNKVDFSADYVNAKFFVIKSYSEDDVHKGIKYNVWSSTTNGNNKLQNAYEDARRIAAGEPRGCPIFLFFSVSYILLILSFFLNYHIPQVYFLDSNRCFNTCLLFFLVLLASFSILLNAG